LVTWVFGPNGADEKACFTEMVQAEMIRWFACLTSFLDTFLFCWGLTYVQRYMYNNKLIHINYIYIHIYTYIIHSFTFLYITWHDIYIIQHMPKEWFMNINMIIGPTWDDPNSPPKKIRLETARCVYLIL
jgi:hypothetical protein